MNDQERDQLYLRSYPVTRDVYAAVVKLNGQKRTTNMSQLTSEVGLSRHTVAESAHILAQRGFIKNVGKGAAYHWRTTGKPMPPEPSLQERTGLTPLSEIGGAR